MMQKCKDLERCPNRLSKVKWKHVKNNYEKYNSKIENLNEFYLSIYFACVLLELIQLIF